MVGLLRTTGDVLDWMLRVIGVGAYVYGFCSLWAERSKYVRRRRLNQQVPPEGSVAVALGVGRDIGSDVKAYISEHFPSPPPPIVLNYAWSGRLEAHKYEDVIRDIRRKLQEIIVTGVVRRVLLFYLGPVSISLALGAIIDNWIPVDVYQYNQGTARYELVYTLDLDTTKGI